MVVRVRLAFLASAAVFAGCAHRPPPPPTAPEPTVDAPAAAPASAPEPPGQIGDATWYGGRLAGHPTASGEPFDPRAMTAAHRTLPLGTWVEVTRLDTGQRVRVRVNDRGPFGHPERIIDLSEAAARELEMLHSGVAHVQVRVVDGP